MEKIIRKAVAAGLMLVIMLVMVITATYAWLTMSQAPEVQGIQVSLAGSSTILIAPNQTRIVNGKVYHYPGKFSQNLHFNNYAQYDYLNGLDGLSPVSTADGLHWFLPTYYGVNDTEVINGLALAGDLKPIGEFTMDTRLEYANMIAPNSGQAGNYICLDFWVVAPNVDYYLRIAQGDETGGSYAIELMKPCENADGGYELVETLGSVAASVRVGFLINDELVLDDTMNYYVESGNCPSAYTSLKGNYNEIGEDLLRFSEYNFTIYEPNGDLHPGGTNGSYIETKPIAWNNGVVSAGSIRDNLTVQLTNRWNAGANGNYYVEEAFQTAISGKNYSSLSAVESDFYNRYLQGNLSSYIDMGDFVTNTSVLYDSMVGGRVSQGTMDVINKSGATDDVVLVHLERNVPQRIRMFVWLEGQDSDCINNMTNVSFALGIELAGSKLSDEEGFNQ